ncbi:excinuclease ABC subunit UvrC [Arcanobacterium pinnipediorum]|uniref:UvrABC system protein C n=1 Tax=Arcanobacterium pinnipediorum TaxID=1503041 RepID=A0ABY5AHH5_9ACTO|nr:excinuclease ABC subunit UvrC [Arcanobacterium pinnipediorum]USR78653.1 excinuclease ABC subunit UvrC [Arcanobacterium pinnipediorum]
MADPRSYRPTDIPATPGVYRFIDDEGRVIYVGKASSLRNRLSNYFQDPAQLHPRTRAMVYTAVDVKWVVVASEIEALTLEYAWIKEFAPRFNVMYRDDKSYPYLAITMSEKYPRVLVTRNAHRRADKYYGPYTKVWAVREALDLLLRVFPMRSCTKGVFNAAQRSGRPCLNGYIDRCAAPCVGRVSDEEHRHIAREMIAFLDSSGEELISEKTEQMKQAALAEDFEKAARLRDDIAALTTVAERNSVVLDSDIDADIFGLEFDELEASVQVFYVRAGRIRGQRGWVTSVEDLDKSALLNQLILQVYGEYAPMPKTKKRSQARSVDDVEHTATDAIPREIWLPALPDDHQALQTWLTQLRGAGVKIRVPQRGTKAQLAQTVHTNAVHALQRHKIERAGDITERSQALEELREGLDLKRAPLRIECYDISHTQGTHQVASMVVFEDGLAKKSDYRHFIVRGPDGTGARDDTAAMDEVLRRRLARLEQGDDTDDIFDDELQPVSSQPTTPRKFAYKPDLIVVDGGLPQVNAAQRVVEDMGADVTIIGLAKRLEEIWIPGEEFPVILSRSSPALRLLQYVRDESHRFAITFHRKKRSKAMTRSALDEIPGLGPAKQKALLKKFGSLAKIRVATRDELMQTPGIGPALADVVLAQLAKNTT